MNYKSVQKTLALIALGGVALAATARAQSVDSLLDKLVDKGILSVSEAKDLRSETDKDFNRAYAAKNGMSDWVSSLKFNGDVRGRYESFYYENDTPVDRQRFRYRLRFSVTANLFDNFEVGMRLTSSEPASGGGSGGDPISGNTTLQDNGSKKFVYLDLAYAKWNPIHDADWNFTTIIGKMENPFVFSEMVFDGDYTPEGAAIQLVHNFSVEHALKLNAGIFSLDEISGNSMDPYLYGGQLRFDSKWNMKWSSSVGIAALLIANDETLNAAGTTWTVPNQNGGNSRTALGAGTAAGGRLLNQYNPIIADASVTYNLNEFWHYKAPFPIKLGVEYMNNPAADSQNEAWAAGVTFGKAGKKGLWELSYKYKRLEGDSWFEELVDSDFGAYYRAASGRSGGGSGYIAGTNVKGHVIKASYSPYDCITLSLTAFITELIQQPTAPVGASAASGTTRLQMDASLKF